MSFFVVLEQNHASKHIWRRLYGFGEFQAIIVMSIPFYRFLHDRLSSSLQCAINGILYIKEGMDVIGLKNAKGLAMAQNTLFVQQDTILKQTLPLESN